MLCVGKESDADGDDDNGREKLFQPGPDGEKAKSDRSDTEDDHGADRVALSAAHSFTPGRKAYRFQDPMVRSDEADGEADQDSGDDANL